MQAKETFDHQVEITDMLTDEAKVAVEEKADQVWSKLLDIYSDSLRESNEQMDDELSQQKETLNEFLDDLK